MVFTEQQLQVKKLVDVQQDIEIDALNDGVGALSSTMQNGFTEAANNFYDIQNSLESMNVLSNERYNGLTGSVNALSNAMTQGFLDMGNTIINTTETIQGQFNDVNNYVGGFENNVNTALQGIQNNFYGMENDYLDRFNQVNANISDSINNFNEQITNELSVNVFSADTMIYNVSATPVSSLTALGYDSNGKIIPVTVIANTNIQLPTSANYLYTDAAGTPYAGMADTAVSTNENLVTSHAVYNAVNDIWTDLNEFHNEVSNSFGDVQNSFNAVDSTFAGVQNQFNDVNNGIVSMNSNIQNQFNEVQNQFNEVQNQFNEVQNQFNEVQNQFNGVNNSIEDSNTILSLLLGFHSDTIRKLYPTTYYNSTSAGYKNLAGIVFAKNTDVVGTSYGNTVLNFNTQTNILTIGTPFGLSSAGFNENMANTFGGCSNLNQNILIPNGVTNMCLTFNGCSNLNQNILIPSSVIYMGATRGASGTFYNCHSLNQNIYLYSDIINTIGGCFYGCTLLSGKYIHIRSSIPMEASNFIYNSLVNNSTGVNWTGHVVNDLPEPTSWPPVN